MENKENPVKQDENRNPDGTFKDGKSGNPNGRPKGKTLKEWARDMFCEMPDKEKKEFLNSLPKDIVWKMAEGNPSNDLDVKTDGKSFNEGITEKEFEKLSAIYERNKLNKTGKV